MENTIVREKLNSTFNLLRIVYAIVPIVAGLDKFTNLLVDWKTYINPSILNMLPFRADIFMYAVGIIEITAGILVLFQPRIGAYIVSLWLIGISLSLLLSGTHFDVAVRDLVMAIGAYSTAKLAEAVDHEQVKEKRIMIPVVNR